LDFGIGIGFGLRFELAERPFGGEAVWLVTFDGDSANLVATGGVVAAAQFEHGSDGDAMVGVLRGALEDFGDGGSGLGGETLDEVGADARVGIGEQHIGPAGILAGAGDQLDDFRSQVFLGKLEKFHQWHDEAAAVGNGVDDFKDAGDFGFRDAFGPDAIGASEMHEELGIEGEIELDGGARDADGVGSGEDAGRDDRVDDESTVEQGTRERCWAAGGAIGFEGFQQEFEEGGTVTGWNFVLDASAGVGRQSAPSGLPQVGIEQLGG